jgi:uncharacterized protein
MAINDGASRLLLPSIERDIRQELTETAHKHAIDVFANNLRGLLNQQPLCGKVVLGVDPGFRTGCKVAVVDETGKLLETSTLYPHEPQKQWKSSLDLLQELVTRYRVNLISIGNGTASRETEQLVADLLKSHPGIKYLITNEAGASVYSASPLARKEFPDLDVSLRGAVSIARRVQDPLAELVKIDPRSIGVGLYQHDVDQTDMKRALDGVVEDTVNRVGVDVNSASAALLAHVSGIGPMLADQIIARRETEGPFQQRRDLTRIKGLGPKAYEQSAGFLRIRGGEESLDATAIHPESYPIAKLVISRYGIGKGNDIDQRRQTVDRLRSQITLEKLAEEIGCGAPTLADILEQLVRPGRDPREDAPPPILRSNILKMEDLKEGMRLKGVVRNVVDFGAFVDIGVKQDGLLHKTQMPVGTILGVADVIDVEIVKIEVERGRISMRLVEPA